MATIEREQEVSQIASLPAAHPALPVKRVKRQKGEKQREKKDGRLKKVERMCERYEKKKKESKQPCNTTAQTRHSRRRGFVRLDHYIITSPLLFVITVRLSHFFPTPPHTADRLITANYFRSVLMLISHTVTQH